MFFFVGSRNIKNFLNSSNLSLKLMYNLVELSYSTLLELSYSTLLVRNHT